METESENSGPHNSISGQEGRRPGAVGPPSASRHAGHGDAPAPAEPGVPAPPQASSGRRQLHVHLHFHEQALSDHGGAAAGPHTGAIRAAAGPVSGSARASRHGPAPTPGGAKAQASGGELHPHVHLHLYPYAHPDGECCPECCPEGGVPGHRHAHPDLHLHLRLDEHAHAGEEVPGDGGPLPGMEETEYRGYRVQIPAGAEGLHGEGVLFIEGKPLDFYFHEEIGKFRSHSVFSSHETLRELAEAFIDSNPTLNDFGFHPQH